MSTLQNRRASKAAVLALSALATVGATAPAFAAVKTDGMHVAIDRATGKLRQPTAAESQALAAQDQAKAATTASNLQITTFGDGTMSAVLTPDYLNVWLLQLNADGSASQVCVDAPNAALPAAPALEEK
jgi:hypothetical protein